MPKSFNINSSSYAGELALPYIAPAILSANTIAQNLVTVHNNVKYKAVLKKLSNDAELVKGAACDFAAVAGNLDLDEVVLTVTELAVQEQLCKKDFRQDWEALQTGARLLGDRVPPNFETFLLQFLAGKVQENIEKSIWGGNFDNADSTLTGGGEWATSFDGFMHLLVDGTPGNDQTGTGAMSSANVLTRLDAMVGLAPTAVLGSESATIYMSRATQFFMQRALGGVVTTVNTTGSGTVDSSVSQVSSPNSGNILTGAIPNSYLGYNIAICNGMPTDAMVFADKGNLHVGNNLYTDQIEAKVVDMSMTDASDNVRVAMRFNAGVQIGTIGDVSCFRRTS